MKKFLFVVLASLVVLSCTKRDYAKVDLLIEGASDETTVILSKLNLNHFVDVDTMETTSERAIFKVPCSKHSPDFFYFFVGDERVASLILSAGDKVSVKTDMKGNISSIEGSSESLLFAEREKSFLNTLLKFDSLAIALDAARQSKNLKEENVIKSEISKEYVAQKRASIRYLYENKKSFTTIPELYRKISDNLPIYGEYRDALFFKMVYDSLSSLYPTSPYIISLADEVDRRTKEMTFNMKLQEAQMVNYPDISLYDDKGVARNLSENDGKVVMLLFWTILNSEQKMFNLELKNIYNKYHDKGFEIYQVSCDPDKTAWARTVKDQQLPWISVHDGSGTASQYLSLYNVKKLPSMFIIEKSGLLSESTDLFDLKKLDAHIGKLVK